MKKQIIAAAILSAAVCLTGCGADISITTGQQAGMSVSTAAVSETAAVTAGTTETKAADSEAAAETAPAPIAEMTAPAETAAAPASAPAAAAEKPDITVTDSVTKAAYQDPDTQLYFVYDCTLPYFECSDPDAATAENLSELNEQMRQIMIAPIREQEAHNRQEVDYAAADQAVTDSPFGNERISVNYQMTYQGNACTVMIDSFWYGGGAHGGNTLSTFMMDSRNMKPIRHLDEISAAPDDFISFAAEYYLTNYADKYAGRDEWNADYLKQGMNGDAAWYFDNNTFFLVFPEYALGACYAEGRPCLEIPLADCLPHLSDYGRQLLQK